ncbi:hypothetical protein [Agromyces cerinus]|uniref:hypothetical protein n=1 Tax=Agromyces cerinus TaxID=33878 RepID=UPI0011788CEA|nr:hypothetical protein [Agromyces cerinus]
MRHTDAAPNRLTYRAGMTSESGARSAPEQPSARRAPIPLWARITVPTVAFAGAAALIAGVVTAGAQPPATVESACRSAIEHKLQSRGHSDVDVGSSLQVAEADGAQRVSGTVISSDESGRVRHAALRCVVRDQGESMRVVSARVSP